MNKYIVATFFIFHGCAHRGYDSLTQEVPELFSDFKAENYERKETPKNIAYLEKVLPESEKNKEEFHKKEYVFKEDIKSYDYYVPRTRYPSFNQIDLFNDMERTKTTYDKTTNAILIR